jgi:hypothetical protein
VNRDQQFLAVAAEALSEVSAIVRESNERAERIERSRALLRDLQSLSRPLKDPYAHRPYTDEERDRFADELDDREDEQEEVAE